MKNIKPVRVFVFFMSVIALSKFFDAGRLIASEQTFAHVKDSLISLFVFVFTLLVMGYWVYVDEKGKNNLKSQNLKVKDQETETI